MMEKQFHVPIMKNEVINLLAPERGGVYVDGTVGGAGHGRPIAQQLSKNDLLVGVDLDPEALRVSEKELSNVEPRIKLVQGDFKNLPRILSCEGVDELDGCLLDLGVSSYQLDTPERGFSYRYPEAPLDMRMNPDNPLTAADIVNSWSKRDIATVLRKYGEERWASRIASFIKRRRNKKTIQTCGELVEVIKSAIPAAARRRGGHPARRTFQALRIAVNDELQGFEKALESIIHELNPGGRMVVISFHSLEDRRVKKVFRRLSQICHCPPDFPVCRCDGATVEKLNGGLMRPTEKEIEQNRRASAAKLRAIRRLECKEESNDTV